MDLQCFFDHWNLSENPFLAEEARNDTVFARTIEGTVAHPDFQKISGSPSTVSTSVVFGEKGSGKTAMRLMMEQRIHAYNRDRSNGRVWMVRYDDLNPVLDRLAHSLSLKNSAECLDHFTLPDHQDAILSLAITDLLDSLLGEEADTEKRKKQKAERKALRRMSRERRLDLAILALLYDQPRHGDFETRWSRLLGLLRLRRVWSRGVHGVITLIFGVAALVGAGVWYFSDAPPREWEIVTIASSVAFLGLGVLWLVRAARKMIRARRIRKAIRVVDHPPNTMTRGLWDLPKGSGVLRLVPDKEDQDKRYEATQCFTRIIEAMGFGSIVVFIDRVDEPVLISSDTERMRKLVWPLLNNKFLQQEGFAVKILLPLELGHLVEREDTDFHRRARLDKQNLINPLRWTGATLYDLCTRRFRNCQNETSEEGRIGELKDLFEDDVDHHILVEALDQMHQPRDAFKFLYAVILRHCENTPGEESRFKIPRLTLEQVRREQSERVMNLYRGVSAH